MQQILSDVIGIYKGYGFEHRPDLSVPKLLVFTIAQGVFDNAIIVGFDDKLEASELASDLVGLGFQVKFERFVSVKKTEDDLFNGFFSVARTKASFKRDYDAHISNIMTSFPVQGASYSYFKSPFSKDSHQYNADDDILQHINDEVKSVGPKLILIEAAAGFGKTCTAYETAKLLSEKNDGHIVLFAELSRDRQAKIFNHVLHKELARSFPAVSPDLVVREIKKGKVIVVLDGFDELLNEREEEKFQFEKSQAMLETIGKILEQNAKVILTTRKTAILQGDDFDGWVSGQTERFDFTRFSLKEPSPRSWLGNERYERLASSRVSIKSLANPVLLTFLRFADDESFELVLNEPDRVVEKYFELLLKREVGRQTLQMAISEQSDFMKRLAQHMMKYNFTRDSKENIIAYFSECEVEAIETARSQYSADVRPTFEAMLEKLSNHALLDRSSIDEKIGFINNFVLGHFVAMDVMETSDEWVAESIFVEAAVNAYSARSDEGRKKLWERLAESLEYCSDEDRVKLELHLLGQVSGVYTSASFNEIVFDTISFFVSGNLSGCCFNGCTFVNCVFDFSLIEKNTFISCSFYNCSAVGVNQDNDFISSVMDEVSSNAIGSSVAVVEVQTSQNSEDEIKAYILEKFWPVGKDTIAFAHRPMFIFYRGAPYPPHAITASVEAMRKDGLFASAKRKNWIGLDLAGNNFQTIKGILGR
ncbi:AAA family ATPase [Pseudomonas donghuensis]|uniref:NACHT domain-containing protein n=1 Tax=Pseudomonas donghuensis TaxID=1163398 RepID=UPI0039E09AC5